MWISKWIFLCDEEGGLHCFLIVLDNNLALATISLTWDMLSCTYGEVRRAHILSGLQFGKSITQQICHLVSLGLGLWYSKRGNLYPCNFLWFMSERVSEQEREREWCLPRDLPNSLESTWLEWMAFESDWSRRMKLHTQICSSRSAGLTCWCRSHRTAQNCPDRPVG